MPFTSMVAAPFLFVLGDSYRAAQIPFVVLSAALVPLIYRLSLGLFGRLRWALLSAALMAGGGTYFPHWTAVDAWCLYPWVGTAVLWLGAAAAVSPPRRRWLLAATCGAAVGLGHLTRADGALLFVSLVVLLGRAPRPLADGSATAFGYLAVMGPWLARNISVFGRPLLGSHLIWLQDYADLFAYDKDVGNLPWALHDWLDRFVAGCQSLFFNSVSLAGALQFVFLPCVGVACWTERRRPIVQGGVAYLLVLFAAMSFVFTRPGPRGSFLHSLSAIIVLLYILAPAGLSRIIAWIAERRPNWDAAQAEGFFSITLFAIGSIVSINAYLATISWYVPPTSVAEIEKYLGSRGESPLAPIFCIDAPTYHYWTRRPALVIPTDGEAALMHAAERFSVRYLVLEDNHPRYLSALYEAPDRAAGFERLASWNDAAGHRVELFGLRERASPAP
jgi:hypothetical protein